MCSSDLNLVDGKTLVDAKLLPERAISDIYLFGSESGRFLVVNGLERSGNSSTQVYPMHGLPGVQVNRARVYGFGPDGKSLWEHPAVVENQVLLTAQRERLPVLMFACSTQERRLPMAGQQKVALVGVDKRTGKLIRPKENPDGSSNLRLMGDPEKKTVEVHLQKEVVTLAFTDQPLEPDPPPEKAEPAGALWRALQRAAGGSVDPIPPLPEKGER